MLGDRFRGFQQKFRDQLQYNEDWLDYVRLLDIGFRLDMVFENDICERLVKFIERYFKMDVRDRDRWKVGQGIKILFGQWK